jgi:UDP-glucose 4-epimerase
MKSTGTEMVFVSSGGTVYGESQGQPHRCGDSMWPICSYGMQKAAIEQFLQLYDGAGEVRCKICRVSNPYGVMPQRGRTQGIIPILLRCLLNGQPITLFGETVRDYIFISDVTEALIAVADYGGSENVFNVGSGVGTGLHALTRLLEERSGLTFSAVDEQPIRTCDVHESVLDISDTVRLLGWTPQVSLVVGVDWTLDALRASEALSRSVCKSGGTRN